MRGSMESNLSLVNFHYYFSSVNTVDLYEVQYMFCYLLKLIYKNFSHNCGQYRSQD